MKLAPPKTKKRGRSGSDSDAPAAKRKKAKEEEPQIGFNGTRLHTLLDAHPTYYSVYLVSVVESGSLGECNICLEDMDEGKKFAITPCMCQYHYSSS